MDWTVSSVTNQRRRLNSRTLFSAFSQTVRLTGQLDDTSTSYRTGSRQLIDQFMSSDRERHPKTYMPRPTMKRLRYEPRERRSEPCEIPGCQVHPLATGASEHIWLYTAICLTCPLLVANQYLAISTRPINKHQLTRWKAPGILLCPSPREKTVGSPHQRP